jgi:hypothetical protein
MYVVAVWNRRCFIAPIGSLVGQTLAVLFVCRERADTV